MATGDVRFTVFFSPDDATSPDDANDRICQRYFHDREVAAAFACEKARDDYFGATSIEKQVCTCAKCDLWDATGTAEACSGDAPGDLCWQELAA